MSPWGPVDGDYDYDAWFGNRCTENFIFPKLSPTPGWFPKLPPSPLPPFPGVPSCSPHCYLGHRIHRRKFPSSLFETSPTVMSWCGVFQTSYYGDIISHLQHCIVLFPPKSAFSCLHRSNPCWGFLMWWLYFHLVPSPVLSSPFPTRCHPWTLFFWVAGNNLLTSFAKQFLFLGILSGPF